MTFKLDLDVLLLGLHAKIGYLAYMLKLAVHDWIAWSTEGAPLLSTIGKYFVFVRTGIVSAQIDPGNFNRARLSVCHWTKTQMTIEHCQRIGLNKNKTCDSHLASNSMMAIANCNAGVKSISHVTGRCALFNVKLHFFSVSSPYTFLNGIVLRDWSTISQCFFNLNYLG